MKKDTNGKKAMESLQAISTVLNADVVLFAGTIGPPHDETFIRKLLSINRRRPNCYLMLETYGGIPDCGFQMMRSVQRLYEKGKITLAVNRVCASTGTLMALGADELAMSDAAQLGPLDVQVRKHDEIGERSSGLTPIQALNTLRAETFQIFENHFLQLRTRSLFQLTTKTCASIAARLTIGAIQPVYAQIDPMRLGEIQRAMMIAYHYGDRLARKNPREETLELLVSGYPSHSAIIDRDEAARLFTNVRRLSRDEASFAEFLDPLVQKSLSSDDEAQIEVLSSQPSHRSKRKVSGGAYAQQSKQTPTDPKTRGFDRDEPASESKQESPESTSDSDANVNAVSSDQAKVQIKGRRHVRTARR